MDERVWRLALGTLGSAVIVVLLDAAIPKFDGLWFGGVCTAMLGFLAARSTFNKNGDDK